MSVSTVLPELTNWNFFLPEDKVQKTLLFRLPKELLLLIVSYLNVQEFCRLRSTCKVFSKFSPTNYLNSVPRRIKEIVRLNYGSLQVRLQGEIAKSNNDITSVIPSSWKEGLEQAGPKVERLDLSTFKMAKNIPVILQICPNLKSIKLKNNSDIGMEELKLVASQKYIEEFIFKRGYKSPLKNLNPIFESQTIKKLKLREARKLLKFTDNSLPCPNLEVLDIKVEDEEELGRASHFRTVKELTLSININSFPGLEVIFPKLDQLQKLILKGARCTTSTFRILSKATSLTSLTMSCELYLADIKALVSLDALPHLTEVYLTLHLGEVYSKNFCLEKMKELDLLATMTQLKELQIKRYGPRQEVYICEWDKKCFLYLINIFASRITAITFPSIEIFTPKIIEVLSHKSASLACRKLAINGLHVWGSQEFPNEKLKTFLEKFPCLEELELHNLEIVTALPLQKIKKLKLVSTMLTHEFYHSMEKSLSVNLKTLSLEKIRKIPEAILISLLKKINLKVLNLSSTNIGDETLAAIVEYQKNIKYLGVNQTKVSAKGVETLGRLTSLKGLSVDREMQPSYLFLRQAIQKSKKVTKHSQL